jgi:hypothetical protein
MRKKGRLCDYLILLSMLLAGCQGGVTPPPLSRHLPGVGAGYLSSSELFH